jgi:hypothetical protein
VYLRSVEGDGWPPPDRVSHYLLGVRVRGMRRSKAGLDLDLVATKHWLLAGSDKAVSGTFALKSCCREVQFQAVVFSVVTFPKLVSLAGRTFRCLLLHGPASALPALHSRLAVLSGKRV